MKRYFFSHPCDLLFWVGRSVLECPLSTGDCSGPVSASCRVQRLQPPSTPRPSAPPSLHRPLLQSARDQHSSPLAGLARPIKASRFILHSLLHLLAPITPSASECHASCFPFVRFAAQHDIISISLTLRFSSLAQVWLLSARDRHIVALCALGSGMEPSFRAGSIGLAFARPTRSIAGHRNGAF
jgi:hypothetical protein